MLNHPIAYFIVLLLSCFVLPAASAQPVSYSEMDKSALRKKVSQGESLAMHWLARKSKVFGTKALWFEKYAQKETRSLSTSYLAALYDDKEEDYPNYKDGEQSYFWYYITDKLCKKEYYKDKWCADAMQRIPELKSELAADKVSILEVRAEDWLKEY